MAPYEDPQKEALFMASLTAYQQLRLSVDGDRFNTALREFIAAREAFEAYKKPPTVVHFIEFWGTEEKYPVHTDEFGSTLGFADGEQAARHSGYLNDLHNHRRNKYGWKNPYSVQTVRLVA